MFTWNKPAFFLPSGGRSCLLWVMRKCERVLVCDMKVQYKICLIKRHLFRHRNMTVVLSEIEGKLVRDWVNSLRKPFIPVSTRTKTSMSVHVHTHRPTSKTTTKYTAIVRMSPQWRDVVGRMPSHLSSAMLLSTTGCRRTSVFLVTINSQILKLQ